MDKTQAVQQEVAKNKARVRAVIRLWDMPSYRICPLSCRPYEILSFGNNVISFTFCKNSFSKNMKNRSQDARLRWIKPYKNTLAKKNGEGEPWTEILAVAKGKKEHIWKIIRKVLTRLWDRLTTVREGKRTVCNETFWLIRYLRA